LANWGCRGRGSTVDAQWRAVCGNREWMDLATIIKADHDQATGRKVGSDELDQQEDVE